MTAPTPQMIVSGVPYAVTEVDDRVPSALAEFAGSATFAVEGATGRHVVLGEGTVQDGYVRFHEKAGAGGKDLRVWHVAEVDGAFQAEVA